VILNVQQQAQAPRKPHSTTAAHHPPLQQKQHTPIILEAKRFESLKPSVVKAAVAAEACSSSSRLSPALSTQSVTKNHEKLIINIKFDSLSTSSLSESSSNSSSLASLSKDSTAGASNYCIKTSKSTPLALNEALVSSNTNYKGSDSGSANKNSSEEENLYNYIESKTESSESVSDMNQNCRGAVACTNNKMFNFEKESLINSSKCI
jgi:hypothetical protein